MTKVMKYKQVRTHLPNPLLSYMEKYKKTRDPAVFEDIFRMIEGLMLRMVWQERKRYKELYGPEILELYGAGLIAMERAIRGFKVERSSMWSFPRYLQGHIKDELKRYRKQEQKYIACGITSVLFEDVKKAYEIAQDQKDWILAKIAIDVALDDMIANRKIPKNSKELYRMRYKDELTYKEMAKKLGGTESKMKMAMRRMRQGLVNYFK